MSRVSFYRVLRFNVLTSVRWWWFFATLWLFLFIGLRSATQVRTIANMTGFHGNVWDSLFISFSGPAWNSSSILEGLTWLLPQLLLAFLIGDIANGELIQRGVYILPLIGSRLQWWWGKIAFFTVVTVLYFFIGFLTVVCTSLFFLEWSFEWSTLMRSGTLWSLPADIKLETIVLWMFLLLCSTSFVTAIFQTTLAIVSRRSFYAFTVVAAILIFSWMASSLDINLVRWLPGDQSMLLRHTFISSEVPGFSITWSLIYNMVWGIFSFSIGLWYVRRMDIVGNLNINPR